MDIVKDLDLDWFWRGYTCGANSRKKLVESPNKVVNLGKQGIVVKPTPKQQISFFIGVKMGRGKIVQNFDVVYSIQYQDKNAHRSKGDYLALEIGSAEAERGAVVRLPFYICNNSVDNRGYIGYQLKIKYDPKNLTLTNITPSTTWLGSFEYEHDTTRGIVLIQGFNDGISYDDCVFGYLDFVVGANAPSTNTISLQGPTGKGTATDLFTLINEELYYIQPVTLTNGTIKIPGTSTPTTTNTATGGSVTLPPVGSSDDLYIDTEFSYEFDLDLIPIDGGSGSGANLGVSITFGDGTTEIVYIPLEEGLHHYKGKIPLKLPSIKPGPIIIEIWVEPEDEDDLYYWFIKAGALWGFENTIPREEVGKLPIKPPKRVVYENFFLYDFAEWWQESSGGSGGEVVSSVEVNEIMQIFDDFTLRVESEREELTTDTFTLKETVEFRQGG